MYTNDSINLPCIHGIGVDLIHQERIAAVLKKYLLPFPKKILTLSEYALLPLEFNQQVVFLSKRFAAKEAFAKALGTGFGRHLHFSDIEILKYPSGQPYYKIADRVLEKFNIKKSHLSFSDDYPQVIAFCVLVS